MGWWDDERDENMTVSELIIELNKLPPHLDVSVVYDGSPRGTIEHVWRARGSDDVLLSAGFESVYDDADRPDYAPSQKDKPYWYIGEE